MINILLKVHFEVVGNDRSNDSDLSKRQMYVVARLQHYQQLCLEILIEIKIYFLDWKRLYLTNLIPQTMHTRRGARREATFVLGGLNV